MKKTAIGLVGIMMTMAISCKKYHNHPPSHESSSAVDDTRTVHPKDVVAVSLPGLYFHFIYNNLHYVTQIDFTSGFGIYDVEYENKKVKKMTNIRSNTKNYFLYNYSSSRVSEINEFSGLTEKKIRSYHFSYNDSHLLTLGNKSLYPKNLSPGDIAKGIMR